MGIPWHQQELGMPLGDWLQLFRSAVHAQLAATGKFDTVNMDHNSKYYVDGLSNKRLKIAANALLGREEEDYDECVKAVMMATFGSRHASTQ